MVKIALIGAGSVVFARRLVDDIVSTPVLAGAKISLMDIAPERLGPVGQYASRLVSDAGAGHTVETTTEQAAALDGADYVVTTIKVGDDLEIDQGLPLRHGVDQSIADTVGPGGVFKALRTVPAVLDICRDIESLCPDAWLLQYTNPMAIECWAIAEATSVKFVGLCHSVQGTTEQLAKYIGAPGERVSAWVAGINHMAWFLRFERDGHDAYPELWEALEDHATFARDPVRFEVMRHFGYFVSESTPHMSEYLPYFRKSSELMHRFKLDEVPPHLLGLAQRDEAHFEHIRSDTAGPAPLSPSRSNEYASGIMEAMETGVPIVINGNVSNDGLVTNLPQGCCVEVPCKVDRLGVHPMSVGDLPPQLASLNRSNIAVQELAVRAVLDRSREAALHAVMLDPLTAAMLPLDRIRAMFDEMWTAHGDQFAEYT